MKTLKFPLIIAALLISSFGIFSFTNKASQQMSEQWYELKPMGNPLERSDYEPAGGNPGCPTTHTAEVCGIYAVDDDGIPSAESFDAILDASDNFTVAYTAKVQYRTIP